MSDPTCAFPLLFSDGQMGIISFSFSRCLISFPSVSFFCLIKANVWKAQHSSILLYLCYFRHKILIHLSSILCVFGTQFGYQIRETNKNCVKQKMDRTPMQLNLFCELGTKFVFLYYLRAEY